MEAANPGPLFSLLTAVKEKHSRASRWTHCSSDLLATFSAHVRRLEVPGLVYLVDVLRNGRGAKTRTEVMLV